MSTALLRHGALLLLCGAIAPSAVKAEDRPADKILADINSALPERLQKLDDLEAVREYHSKMELGMKRRSELIGELYASHPDTPELAELLPWRWTGQSGSVEANAVVRAEIKDVIAKSKDEKMIASAYYGLAMLADKDAGPQPKLEDVMPSVEDFCRRFPKDQRGGVLLMSVAGRVGDQQERERIFERVLKDYSGTRSAGAVEYERKRAEGLQRRLARVGKPFELEFTEATKGTPITMASLKGKVIVVDFWATWCGPCVAEMPKMKDLYAKYKDKGVEFVGVSLDQPRDQGGYDALKSFVEKNKIEWPQYYEAKVSAQDFAMNWGITGIPTVFAVDAEGKLFTTAARGKLEELIPELLEKAKTDEAKP